MQIRISEELNTILGFAREEAMRTGSFSVGPDQLFLALLRHADNSACDALRGLEVDMQELKQFIDQHVFTNEQIPYSQLDKISFSRPAHNVLSISLLEATRLRAAQANPSHLLLALLRCQGSFGLTYLRDLGVDYGRITSFFENTGTFESERISIESAQPVTEESESPSVTVEKKESQTLEDFGFDLTLAAANGQLDPLVGREEEMERVIQVLGRRKKNNPMLVGEPGVGKSAIVEGIAARIASSDVPENLVGKRLVSLDIASVVAGTRYRGDFEKRLKSIIEYLKEHRDIILFIDEFHTVVGAGGASGSLDAANMLKPALARGDIQCIGATTMDEFSKIVEKDAALDRRFQKVVVEPSTVSKSVDILNSLAPLFQQHHHVNYSAEALESCVILSERYVTDRCLPDKAIDVMDEAGSMIHIMKGKNGKRCPSVTADDVALVVSKMTDIPVSRVLESESQRLVKMESRLKNCVIGQEEAVGKVVKAVMRSRAGIKDPDKPIGSFIFFGPTGVGKTQLAKSLAQMLFGSETDMVRIDMSEYTEKINATRLIGAPPGYVGYEDGGQLSEKVRRKPYCVVLLDEIEKAHPDVFNLLLQVLDEGRLTDSNGRIVNFRNTIVIMTSNVGSREVNEFSNGVGFAASAGKENMDERRRMLIEKAVKNAFPPEFVNRIDEQVYFNSLSKEDMEKIVSIEIRELQSRLSEAGCRLDINKSAVRFLSDVGYDPAYGARPLKRAVRKYLEDPISEAIIHDRLTLGKQPSTAVKTFKFRLSKDKSGLELTRK